MFDWNSSQKKWFYRKPFKTGINEMPTNRLYHTWIQQIRELRPEQRITQVRNFVWLMIGIYQSRSVYLRRVAGKIPGHAKMTIVVQQLGRVLFNPAIPVAEWLDPF